MDQSTDTVHIELNRLAELQGFVTDTDKFALYDTIAKHCVKIGAKEQLVTVLNERTILAAKIFGSHSQECGRALLALGLANYKAVQLEDAIEHLRLCQPIFESNPKQNKSLDFCNLLWKLGSALSILQRRNESIKTLQHCCILMEALKWTNSNIYHKALNMLAFQHDNSGDRKAAKDLYLKLVKAPNCRAKLLVMANNRLGAFCVEGVDFKSAAMNVVKGADYASAETYFKASAALLAKDDPFGDYGQALVKVAFVLQQQGKNNEAIDVLYEARKFKGNTEAGDRWRLSIVVKLCELLCLQERDAEAEKLCVEAKVLFAKYKMTETLESARVCLLLSNMFVTQKRFENAAIELWKLRCLIMRIPFFDEVSKRDVQLLTTTVLRIATQDICDNKWSSVVALKVAHKEKVTDDELDLLFSEGYLRNFEIARENAGILNNKCISAACRNPEADARRFVLQWSAESKELRESEEREVLKMVTEEQ